MSISRNAGYSLIGSIAPIAIGILAVPLYLKIIGADRYGVLAISFLLLGYFGLFDLGLGRALIFRISSLKIEEENKAPGIFFTATVVNLVMGLIGGAILFFAASFFFSDVFKVDDQLRPEMIDSAIYLAMAVPIATLTGALTGALHARSQFLLATKISIFSTTAFQLVPLAVAWINGPALPPLLATAVLARMVTVFLLWLQCRKLYRGHGAKVFVRSEARLLLGYGGWVTATAMFGPVMVILDRLAIGAILGPVAVTIYTVPFQLAQRIGIFPGAMVSALFPRLPSANEQERAQLTDKASRVLLASLSLPILTAIFAIYPAFELWIGKDLGVQSAAVGVPIIFGFWVNAFAVIPYILLHAIGRPDKVTKILLLEIPPYLVLLWFSMREYGLLGCSFTFALRSTIDFVLMSWTARGRVTDGLLILAVGGIILVGASATYLFDYRQLWWWASFFVLALPLGVICWLILPLDLRARAVQLARARLPFVRS